MKAVNKAGQKTLKKLAEMAAVNGGYVKINNRPGFMPVVVEHIGTRVLSVAHYYKQCGDLMADPEMTFWLGPDDNYYPASFKQDNLGVYKESLFFGDNGKPASFRIQEQADQAVFAGRWMSNIRSQQGL